MSSPSYDVVILGGAFSGASAALLIDWLRGFDISPTLYIPDRIDEGYGPNVPAMEALAADHPLILCVDCGTLSHDPLAAARAKGMTDDQHAELLALIGLAAQTNHLVTGMQIPVDEAFLVEG